MHPAEIAKELTNHMFFSQFSDEFLFQIATLMRPTTFAKKSKVLTKGEHNKTLFFLRKGTINIEVDGEVILETNVAGEVFGEMSIISEGRVPKVVENKRGVIQDSLITSKLLK